MKRYAVYYAPPPGDFADLTAAWLGWDAVRGMSVEQPELAGLPMAAAALTDAPRKYGFHGTLKPPFRLAEGRTVAGLQAACADLAAGLAPVTLPGLALHRIGGFLALTPEGDTAALLDLAARVVTGLDGFRAGLTEAEVARRRPERLTVRQRELLDLWGYPYVLEEFQFHLTLSDDLAPDVADATARALTPYLAPVLPRPFCVDALCLFGEDAAGRFHLLHRYALGG